MVISEYKQEIRWAEELDHVFTIKDLQLIAKNKSAASVFRLITSLQKEGDLIKVKRGLYATEKALLTTIANRIYPDSYISTGTVLAKKAVIGSIPARRVQAIRKGVPRTFSCPLGTIEFLSISPKLYFGFERQGYQLWASPEKAYLDTCYYYFCGKQFSFDPASDVNLKMLDSKLIEKFLKKYDQRFVTFFERRFKNS